MAKRKLAQRKGAAKKAEQVEEENPKVVVEEEEVKHDEKEDAKSHEEAQKQQKQVKKVARKPRKRIKPDSEPEYFEDKRNLVYFLHFIFLPSFFCLILFSFLPILYFRRASFFAFLGLRILCRFYLILLISLLNWFMRVCIVSLNLYSEVEFPEIDIGVFRLRLDCIGFNYFRRKSNCTFFFVFPSAICLGNLVL